MKARMALLAGLYSLSNFSAIFYLCTMIRQMPRGVEKLGSRITLPHFGAYTWMFEPPGKV